MAILSRQSIAELCITHQLITPWQNNYKFCGVSGGLSHCGYDISIAEDIIMWPGRFKLASTVERFNLPDNIAMVVMDKSTWARRGLTVQNTIGEPGWGGVLTLELTLHSFKVLTIEMGTPIAQVVFHTLDEPTDYPYPKNGKYQNQEAGPQAARFR